MGKAVAGGDGKVRIEQVECVGDSIKVVYAAETPAAMKLTADGMALAQIGEEFDEATGRGRVKAYPVLKLHERLGIDVKGSSGPLEVKLP